MKPAKHLIGLFCIVSLFWLGACSSSSNSTGSGQVSIVVTDARPMLAHGAESATNLEVIFTEVAVHTPQAGWRSLPLGGEAPHNIDLLQFHDGVTTELVPPVLLEYGRYTQIRVMVSEARISFDNGENWLPVEIPPEHLKTDKNFTFDVTSPAAVKIVADFDLSQSLVVTDVLGVLTYKLKPVLHVVETVQAASISGTINGASFDVEQAVVITVLLPNPAMASGYEEYTRLALDKSATEDPTGFKIYWLVPDNAYRVEIDFNPAAGDDPEYVEEVTAGDLGPGADFPLNNGVPL